MGPLGWQETVFIFVLALLIFGPRKLPELGKTVGKAITEFRRASNDLKATFNREMNALEREGESLRDITNSYQSEISSYNYDTSYSSYEDNYGSSSYDSTATNSSTVSASATEGAESTAGVDVDSGETVVSAEAGETPSQTETVAAEAGGTLEEPGPGVPPEGPSTPDTRAVTT